MGQQRTVIPETDCRVDPGVNTWQKDVELHTLNQSCFPGLTLTARSWWRWGTGVWSYNYFKIIGLVKPGGADCNPSGQRDWDRIACSSLPGSRGEFQAHLSKLLETLSQALRLQKDLVLPQHAGGQVCPSCDGSSETCPLPQAQIFELLAHHGWSYLRSWCALAGGSTSLGWALRAHSLTPLPVHALRFKLAVESDLCFPFQPLALGLQLLRTLIPLEPYTQIYPLFLKLPLVTAKTKWPRHLPGKKKEGKKKWG